MRACVCACVCVAGVRESIIQEALGKAPGAGWQPWSRGRGSRPLALHLATCGLTRRLRREQRDGG